MYVVFIPLSVCPSFDQSQNHWLACRYEKGAWYDKQRQKHRRNGAADAAQPTKEAFQRWQARPSNERCRWCCGLFGLLLIIFGPLFYFSTSAVIGQRKPLLVEGVRLRLDVRSKAGSCARPDADGCTVDEYTLWSSSSATITGVQDTFDPMGPLLDHNKVNAIKATLHEKYT